ncbi:YitT family protein [Halobacillus litoralis]|uniref:YczE/YyaS/YitT family protein n=1 Tax=Halobacillus litoralis TaxID=45668 RepID=UPI001CD5A8E9|nr:YitT family protein [Halobacillus litoralis]MCA0972309.1 YitT family protein [Halobacillus litoralis]
MKRSYQRFFYYVKGITVLALGIALTIQSRLGTSPFDALLVGLYRTFGLTIGSWEIAVGFTMIVFNSVVSKKRPELFAIATSLLTGAGIDFWMFVIEDTIVPQTIATQWICLLLGIIISALGIATNLQADFAPNPFDRMMLVINQLTGWSISFSRIVISIVLVILAALFGGAIGIGTVLITLFSGAIIHLFMTYLDRFDQRFFLRQSAVCHE